MPQGRRVLSTDPNAGAPVRRVLSTDPNAGAVAPETPAVAASSRREDVMRDALRVSQGNVADLSAGMRARAASTVFGGGDLIRRGWNAVAPDVLDVERVIERPAVKDAMTAPESLQGQVGYGVQGLAEFMYPLSRVSTAMRAAPTVAKVGAEATTSAGIASAQGGDPVTAAATGAAGPLINRVAQAPVVQRVAASLREGAEKRITQALGATKERFKATAEKVAPKMLDRRVPGAFGASRQGLLERAREEATAYGRAIDTALEGAADDAISTRVIADALEDAKGAFQIPRRMSVTEATRRGVTGDARDVGGGMVEITIPIDERPLEQLAKLQQTIAKLGETATVGEVVAVRRAWDDVVERAGGFSHRKDASFGVPLAEQSEAWAKREGGDAIRQLLATDKPDIAALNKQFSFWADIRDVLSATQKRTQAQHGGLGQKILGGAGITAGAMTGDTTSDRVQNAVIGGLVGKQLISAVTSPRWRFVSADVRNRLADALATGRQGDVLSALVRASAALNSGAMRPVPAH